MDRIATIIGFFLLVPLLSISQTYQQRFEEAYNSLDSAAQHRLLAEWQANKPLDAGLQSAYFNFYKQRYQQEEDPLIQEGLISEAFSHINSGLKAAPGRLDLWTQKISFLWSLGRYIDYRDEILGLLDQHDALAGDWLWKEDAKVLDATDFVLTYVDSYVVQLYNLKTDTLHSYMDDISNRVLLSYPQHVASLSNLAVTDLYRGEYDSAIGHLTKALAVEPKNTGIMDNLAYAYAQTGNIEQAGSYYREMIKHGDSQTKAYAERQLEKLSERR